MDEETVRRIFLPYEQGDSSFASAGGGLGLGLSICKRWLSRMAGTLRVIRSGAGKFLYVYAESGRYDEAGEYG